MTDSTRNTLQAYRDLPIREYLFVPPTRRHKRFYQRGIVKASRSKNPLKSLLSVRLLITISSVITFKENMKNFSTRLKNRDYPATTVEKTSLRGQFP